MATFKLVMKWPFALLFITAGVLHLVRPGFFVSIMPPYLPWPVELVYISGVCEIGLGIMLLIPRFTPLAGWGLIALLIAVFPANVHMALYTDQYPQFAPSGIGLRLPVQAVFIAWAYWYTQARAPAVKVA